MQHPWDVDHIAAGKSPTDLTIKYAFVTFKSMEGKEKAEKLFSYAEYKHKQGEGDGSEKFYDRFMSCETVVAPSSLRWKNI